MIADRLVELGIELPPLFPPAGNYLSCVVVGNTVHVGGHGPINGADIIRGKVGRDLTLEQARHAARTTGLSILATLQAELGTLDRIERVIKVFGMAGSTGERNKFGEFLHGHPIAEGFARPSVEASLDSH